MMVRAPFLDRFWAKVDTSGDCWVWRGANGGGSGDYGHFGCRITRSGAQAQVLAHRLSWELAHGEPVPRGMHVLHRCDNPPCVNPAHLWLGTAADNNRDAWAKGCGRTKPREPITWFKHNGRTENLSGWARVLGISREAMRQRYMRHGWPAALLTRPQGADAQGRGREG